MDNFDVTYNSEEEIDAKKLMKAIHSKKAAATEDIKQLCI